MAARPPKSRRSRHASAWAWHCCPCVAHKRTPQRTKCLIDFQLHGLSCWRVFWYQLRIKLAPQVQSGQTIDAGGLQMSESPTLQTTASPNLHYIPPVGDANICWCTRDSFILFVLQKLGMQHACRLPTLSQVSLQLRNGCLHFCFLQGPPKNPARLQVRPTSSNPTGQALSCLACSPISSTSCHGNATLLWVVVHCFCCSTCVLSGAKWEWCSSTLAVRCEFWES